MKFFYILFTSMLLADSPSVSGQVTYLVEAEQFQFPDRWNVADEAGVSGTGLLKLFDTPPTYANAYTAIHVATAGSFSVWARARDFPESNPGSRRFKVYVNEVEMATEAGQHGMSGFYWEKVGIAALDTGEALLRIRSNVAFARFDALVLATDTAFNPNSLTLDSLKTFKITPKTLAVNSPESLQPRPYLTVSDTDSVNCEINNGRIRLRLLTVMDTVAGIQRIVASTRMNKSGQWLAINPGKEDNRVSLIYDSASTANFLTVYPSWNSEAGYSSFESIGQTFYILDQANSRNPFNAGKYEVAHIISATKISAQEIQAVYETDEGHVINASWKLKPNNDHLHLTLQMNAPRVGAYSFVVEALQPVHVNEATNVQLPPMFQYQRIPEQPLLAVSALTPQPLAIVETMVSTDTISVFVSATQADFPMSWGRGESSPMGFSIKNQANMAQPVSVGPVMGFADSRLDSAQSVQREFVIGAVWKQWDKALQYLSDSVLLVTDYRSQNVSLTEAGLNMIDLINTDTSAGWDSTMKGFYDIEENPVIAPTVVQAGPLTILSAAVLAHDEEMYIRRALPTIEYTLSRRGHRWSNKLGATSVATLEDMRLSPYSVGFNVAYFEGVHKLLGETNPWLIDLAMPNGQLRSGNTWTERLAAYRMTGDAAFLTNAITNANSLLTGQVYATKTSVLDPALFYNVSFYPNWWDLLDIYELTKDPKYLAAAERSAFFTIAGIRSYPMPSSSNLQTIHPNNEYSGITNIWWKGSQKFRLGYPRTPGDVLEKQVTEDIVSPVGLGFEQPSTFFFTKSSPGHVYMSSWSPSLLRLYQHTGNKIFQTYARNATIGRFGNYPGYYAKGFTDLVRSQDYPYSGPDVTSIYFHHITSHLAYTMDYLVTEATQRSQGNISLPFSRQEGFVWFNNRVYGGGKGKAYTDRNVELVFKRGLTEQSNAAINYLTLVSDKHLWVIAMNECDNLSTGNFTLGDTAMVSPNSVFNIHDNSGCDPVKDTLSGMVFTAVVPAKGLISYAFPLNTPGTDTVVPKVTQGMQAITVDSSVGKFYVFRIRSPFGWDSIYGYLETPPVDSTSATLINDFNAGSETKNTYPYEWSLLQIPQGTPVALTLNVTVAGVPKTISVTMPGTP